MDAEVVKFNYPEVFVNNYRYMGSVKNHNDLSNYGGNKHQISLESA